MMTLRILKFILCLVMVSSLACATPPKDDATISSITSVTSGITDYAIRFDPGLKSYSGALSSFQKNFARLLKEKLNSQELTKINNTLQKVGGQNLMRISEVLFTQVANVLTSGSLPDINLTIPPSYDALLEKKIKEEKLEKKLKGVYLAFQLTQKGGNENASFNTFVARAKKHFKKAISDNFTEDQFKVYSEFESSKLGKRFFKIIEESVVLSLPSKGK